MENQNTILINPRENPSFNEIHTQETIFGKQSQFTVYNPILRRTSPQKRRSDITLRFLLLITSLQTLIFEQRLHPSTNSPRIDRLDTTVEESIYLWDFQEFGKSD